MIQVNNAYSFDFSVINYEPQILSMIPNAQSVLVGDMLTVVAEAFDVEGDKVDFTWYDGSGTELSCPASSGNALSGECMFTITLAMVPTLEIRATAADQYNSVDETLLIDVAVQESFTASGLADGFNCGLFYNR